jgi:hypothetical protein
MSDKETLIVVMEEFTQELKLLNQNIGDLIAAGNTNTGKLDEIKKDIGKPQEPVATQGDTFVKMALKEIAKRLDKLERQPQSIVKKFQVLLFPEQDAKLFYKIVFGRWLVWLTVMLAINKIYNLGIHYSDVQKSIQAEQFENERIRKSWNLMYNNGNKQTKRQMEKAYQKSGEIDE